MPNKKIVSIVLSPLFFYILASIAILALNLTPMIAHLRRAPEGRTFALMHNNAQDFFFYQAIMNQGRNGQWLTTDPYTTEPHQPSFIFAYFVWIGHIARILHLTPAVMYHVMRLGLAIALLAVVWILFKKIDVPYPRLTALFFFFSSAFMHLMPDGGFAPYMYWWTGMDPVRRIAYLPHHMFGNVFLIVSFLLILQYLKSARKKYLFIATTIALPLAFIHPPSVMILLIVIPSTYVLYHFINFIANKGKIKEFYIPYTLIGLLAYWVIGLLFLLFMVNLTSAGFPWTQYINFEKNLQFPLDRELIPALGIIFPIALFGMVKVFQTRKLEHVLILCWFAIPLLFIPFAKQVNLSNIRLTQGIPFLPLAILAGLGVYTIQEDFINKLLPARNSHNHRSVGASEQFVFSRLPGSAKAFIAGNIIPTIALILFTIFSYPAINWSVRDQIREYWPIYGNVYLDNRLFDAFKFIDTNYPKDTFTYGTFYTGNYLPAFTHTVSYIGHFGYTNNYKEKEHQAILFYNGMMKDEEVKELFQKEKLTLIIQGPEEKPLYKGGHLFPNVLKPIYDTDAMTIYTLK